MNLHLIPFLWALMTVCALETVSAQEVIDSPIKPLPSKVIISNPEKAELGRLLFYEKHLSKDNSVSCASCHNIEKSGSDDHSFSAGVRGAMGVINTPTVFNSVFNFKLFWNGRARNLEEQLDGPLLNEMEMSSTWDEILRKLKSDPNYESMFNKVFKDGITPHNVKNAIAEFEKALVTPDARFDLYLRGDKAAISALELEGYQKFNSFGCIACHQGMNVGGNMFQTMGVMGDYFKDRGTPITEADFGRYNVSKVPSDKFVFRVPSLRNVELTAPYFHDASAKTLEKAIRIMAQYQLGRKLSDQDVVAISGFLKTLTGKTPQIVLDAKRKELAQ